MLPYLQHLPVNWVNGMKITQEHLLQTERRLEDGLRDNRALLSGSLRFGLLPSPVEGEPNLHIEVNPDEVMLHQCRALTPGGARIEFTPHYFEPLRASIPQAKSQFILPEKGVSKLDVVLSVNPFNHTTGGNPDPEEEPARMPYALPRYSLDLLPAGQFNTRESPFHLIVARVEMSESAARLDEHFIPPCTSLYCHERLVELHRQCVNSMKNVFSQSKTINRRLRDISAKSTLQSSLFGVVDWVTLHLAQTLDTFEHDFPKRHPSVLFDWFKSTARVFQTSFEVVQTDLLLKHLHFWLQKNSSQLEGEVDAVLEMHFDAGNTALAATTVLNFTQLLAAMFQKLEQRKRYDYMEDQDDI